MEMTLEGGFTLQSSINSTRYTQMTMKFVIALIALFAVSAMAQYDVTSVYRNNCTTPENLVGYYMVTATKCSSSDTCTQFGASSFFGSLACNIAMPTISRDWVVISQGAADCSGATSWLAAAPGVCFPFGSASLLLGNTPNTYATAKVNSCGANNATTSVVLTNDETLAAEPLCGGTTVNANYTCTVALTVLSVTLTQCEYVMPPPAEPVADTPSAAAPTADGPVAGTQPTTTTPPPPTTPKATPRASSAAALAASGLLAVVALL
jgi:hypothetical protein